LIAATSTPELSVFAVIGLALALLGGALISDFSGWGERLVDRVPKSLRMGSVEGDRKKYGWGYLVVGIVVVVVCATRL